MNLLLTEITNTVENIYHCYVIQDLVSTTTAQYNTSCNNDYINNYDKYIGKEINNLKNLQSLNELDMLKGLKEEKQIFENKIKDICNNGMESKELDEVKNYIDEAEQLYEEQKYKMTEKEKNFVEKNLEKIIKALKLKYIKKGNMKELLKIINLMEKEC